MSSGAAIFVMGPAGSGKSTFCSALMRHCENLGRMAHIINLDPAAEEFDYEPSKDIRDLITVEDAMEELQYGPNGGLIFCLEYLLENVEWLSSDLGDYQDEFLIVDCPGQIELYTHSEVMPQLVDVFRRADYKVCALYLLESQFIDDIAKFFAGILTATSVMLQLGIPHLNVISKMDLITRNGRWGDEKDEEDEEGEGEDADIDIKDELHEFHRYLFPDPTLLEEKLSYETKSRFYQLNKALVQLVDEYDMVNFIPLNILKESSIENIMVHIEFATQYGEALEPKEPH